MVAEFRHVEHLEEGVDRLLVLPGEDFVDVADDGLHVGGAVGRHALQNRLEVAPEVAIGNAILSDSPWANGEATHMMLSTTADDAYPAWNRPGLLDIHRVKHAPAPIWKASCTHFVIVKLVSAPE